VQRKQQPYGPNAAHHTLHVAAYERSHSIIVSNRKEAMQV